MGKVNRRFDVMMPPELAQDMQDLVEKTGLPRTEIFRDAMALYKKAKEIQMSGGNIIMRQEDGTLKEIIGF